MPLEPPGVALSPRGTHSLRSSELGRDAPCPRSPPCPPDRADAAHPSGGGSSSSPQPSLTYLVVPVEGRFLEEFFNVEFGVINLAPEGFPLVDVPAQLDLPSGLSLAPTRDGQQPTIELGEIEGGAFASTN